MSTIEKLKKKKNEIEKQMKLPPHQRDGRLFRYRSAPRRLEDIEAKIKKKKERKKSEKRRRETRRKILTGAGFMQKLDDKDLALEDYLQEHAPEDWIEDVQEARGNYNQLLATLGALTLRDKDPDEYKSLLENILGPENDDWELFPEFD